MQTLITRFERIALARPWLTLLTVIAICAVFAAFAPRFQLDASADSLLLEADPDLRYYRAIRARYGSDDYLIITYSLDGERSLFSDAVLERLGRLRDELSALPGIASVTTILDVPLVGSPPITIEELQESVPTLTSPRTDRELAEQELTESPLYRQLLMSLDGDTTALLVTMKQDETFEQLLRARDELRVKDLEEGLSAAEQTALDELDAKIRERRKALTGRDRETISQVRALLEPYRQDAEIRIGGLPMIVVDMLDYILRDVVVFGIGISIFLAALLVLIFRRPRWVFLPLACCLLSAVVMTGLLGLLRWPVTVVSANFIALLLIFSLSLTVHLIVRYQELHANNPEATQRWLVMETTRDKWQPCAYNALTTMVAFGSLTVSGIRPVMDFGWLMVIGMGVVLAMAFSLFPASLMLVPSRDPQGLGELTGRLARGLAAWVDRHPVPILALFALLAVVSGYGLTQLKVENRFIDNFKEDTEIYQGLVTIDRELGGTTPLDVILNADPEFQGGASGPATTPGDAPASETGAGEEPGEADEFVDEFDDEFQDEFVDEFDDEFVDEFADEPALAEDDLGATSYWFNSYKLRQVGEIHDYLESLPETGKVLSMHTVMETLKTINEGERPDTFFLSLAYKNAPEDVKDVFFDPYMSADGNQLRISVRVFESDPDLRRQALLDQIRSTLTGRFDLEPEQVRLTGMLVLYNNVLQSLYRSQVLTLGFVFLAILVMFVLLFRSLKVGLIALVPNLLAAGVVLGSMGLAGVPLDIMTITIAAITVGIGVDDSIHYVHRFQNEFAASGDYRQAMLASHRSIGRAMFYTSVIIAAGFSILVLSNFIPTIYFGLFTSLAMLFAMIANLSLLPLLLIRLKPLGPEQPATA